MRSIRRLAILVFPVLAVILSACGDLNTVLTEDAAYRVSAFVGTRDVADASILRKGDAIRPAFLSSLSKDPDVVNLTVSLQSLDGKPLADDIVYGIVRQTEARSTTSTGASNPSGPVSPPEAKPSGTLSPANTNPSGPANPGSATESKSGGPVSGSSASPADTYVFVRRLDDSLPTFALPADLPVGTYMLVYKVGGRRDTLAELRQTFYYIADATFRVGELRSYPPGKSPSSTAPIFPGGINLYLSVPVDADARLKPYAVWSLGGKQVRGGLLSKGSGAFLWKTPEQYKFHTLKVEVFPFPPGDGSTDISGDIRNLTIAVSSDAPLPGLTVPKPVRAYKFLGDLVDSMDPKNKKKVLASSLQGDDMWMPVSNSYGLEIGDQGAYGLAEAPLPVQNNAILPGELIVRFAALADGPVFKVSYDTVPLKALDARPIFISLSIKEMRPVLDIDYGSVSKRLEGSALLKNDDFTTIRVFMAADPEFFSVGMIAYEAEESKEYASAVLPTRIQLDSPLSGTGQLQFGVKRASIPAVPVPSAADSGIPPVGVSPASGQTSSAPPSVSDADQVASDGASPQKPPSPVKSAVIDEFIVRYIETVAEQDAPEKTDTENSVGL